MKRVLDYIGIPALGEPISPPFEKFDGMMAAKIKRAGFSTGYVAVRWNPLTLAPDSVFNPDVCLGGISEILELYKNPVVAEKVDSDDVKKSDAPEPSAYDLITIAVIKKELIDKFEVVATKLNGKNKAELYELLMGFRAEASGELVDEDGKSLEKS